MDGVFKGFAQVWSAVCFSDRVAAEPVSMTVAGEPVVLFRTQDGVSALLDRCPHRGARLSMGTVTNDCLKCPYHGWEFRGSGEVAAIPLNTIPTNRHKHSAVALPVREQDGLIWLYTCPTSAEPPPPFAPLSTLSEQGWTVGQQTEDAWDAHWTRAMENYLDFSHFPVVHANSFAKRPAVQQVEMRVESTAEGLIQEPRIPAKALEEFVRFQWSKPNAVTIDIVRLLADETAAIVRDQIWVIPAEEDRSRILHLISHRGLKNFVLPKAALAVTAEDAAIVGSQRPKEVPPHSDDPSVATDKASLMFRRYYHDHLRSSLAPSRTASQGGHAEK